MTAVRPFLRALGFGVLAAMSLAAGAQNAPTTTVTFDIGSQPLNLALTEFAQQSGLQVVFVAEIGRGLNCPGLSGAYTPQAALSQLLVNTPFIYDFINPSTVAIRAKSDAISGVLPADGRSGAPIRLAQKGVAASQDSEKSDPATDSSVGEVLVFGTLDARLSVGSKSGQSLRETPKSITVLTGERIQAQQLTSLQEALVQTTGVTVAAFSPLDTFYYSRGIRLQTLQFEGGAPAYNGGDFGFFYTPDTATLERIEVLRGVDGMYSGAGEPGGVINLIRKRPQRTAAVQLDMSAGNWNNYRGILDTTGPLALDGRLRGRAVASWMDRGYFWDRYTTGKDILFGSLELDVTDSMLLTAGGNYEKRDDDGFSGWSGFPRFSDGRSLGLPRDYNTAPDWSRWHIKTWEAFAKIEQKYGETGTLRLNVNQINQKSRLRRVGAYGAVDPATLGGARIYGVASDYKPSQRLADLSASGNFRLFGRSHGYTFGADYAKLDGGGLRNYSMPGFDFIDGVAFDFFQDNPALIPEPSVVLASTNPVNQQSQRGFYGTVGLQLSTPLRLTLGARHGRYSYHQVTRNATTGEASVLAYTDDKLIPSAALSYTLSQQWTTYLSYGENFKAQAQFLAPPAPGSAPLSPITGDNLELGIKGEVFRRMNAAAAIYRLTREGQGVLDPTQPPATNPADGSSCCYITQGKITVEGLDVELSGAVLPDWQVFAGYTFTRTDYVGTATGASTLSRTPKHQLKIWNTWRLPGQLARVTLNTGVIAQTSSSYTDFRYGGYALWNASVQYRMTDNWTVAVYGDNLLDKVYAQPTGTLDYQNAYGTPRSVNLSIRGRW